MWFGFPDRPSFLVDPNVILDVVGLFAYCTDPMFFIAKYCSLYGTTWRQKLPPLYTVIASWNVSVLWQYHMINWKNIFRLPFSNKKLLLLSEHSLSEVDTKRRDLEKRCALLSSYSKQCLEKARVFDEFRRRIEGRISHYRDLRRLVQCFPPEIIVIFSLRKCETFIFLVYRSAWFHPNVLACTINVH